MKPLEVNIEHKVETFEQLEDLEELVKIVIKIQKEHNCNCTLNVR